MITLFGRLGLLPILGQTNPNVSPNESGLPGLSVARKLVGALLTWGLVAAVAALAISSAYWAVSSNSGNYHGVGKGKQGVLVSAGAAILLGGANAIIAFFGGLGSEI